jgi:hypothetical protein
MNQSSHRKRYRWLALAAAAVAVPALTLPLVLSGAAQAGTLGTVHRASTAAPALQTPPNCPNATLCLYNNTGYTGTQWNFPYSQWAHLKWHYLGDVAANDKPGSLYNHRAWVSYLAKNCPEDNQTYAWAGGARPSNLGNWQWPNGTSMYRSASAFALGTSDTVQTISHFEC